MGSWNETCAISSLPIEYSDEVVFFLIEESSCNDNTHCMVYSSAEWAPRGIHLYATYEDYGRYAIQPSAIEKLTLESFKDDLFEMEQGENEYHEREVKLSNLSWEMIQTAIYDNRLHVKQWMNVERYGMKNINPRVTRVAVLRKVFDEIVNTPVETFRSKFDIKNVDKSVDEYVMVVGEAFQQYRDDFKGKGADKDIWKIMASTSYKLTDGLELSKDNLLYHLAGTVGESYFVSWNTKSIITIVKDLIMNSDETPENISVAKEILTELAKFNIFSLFFDMTRHRWSPTCGAGSQSANYTEYLTLNKIISKICKKRIKSYEQ